MATATTPAPPRNKPWIAELYGSALGKKYAMAISGIMMLGYVVAHMVGNLKIYLGAESINFYGEWLRNDLLYPILPHGYMLWILRIGLLGALIIHVHAAWSLTRMNQNARKIGYQSKRDYVVADFAARTMRLTGVVVLAFIGFHLADLTFGVEAANPGFESGQVYNNVVASFTRVPVALFYIIAQAALGLHIFHGTWSLFQTLGINNKRFNQSRRAIAVGITALVVIGNISFPVAVMTRIIDAQPPTAAHGEEG